LLSCCCSNPREYFKIFDGVQQVLVGARLCICRRCWLAGWLGWLASLAACVDLVLLRNGLPRAPLKSACPPAPLPQPDGRVAHFELVLCKSVDTYVRVKQNQNQVVWKWKKVSGQRQTEC
jgi:hypothetical protein